MMPYCSLIPALVLKFACGFLSSAADTLHPAHKRFAYRAAFRSIARMPGSERNAFSLTEIAIVMGVMGVLLAGIWSYVSAANETVRIEKAKEEILTVVQKIRGYYAGQAGMLSAGTDLITAQLAAAGIFPNDMLRPDSPNNNCHQMPGLPRLCPDAPWGPMDPSSGWPSTIGSFMVCQWLPGYVGYCPSQ